jgi:hypothetical protein
VDVLWYLYWVDWVNDVNSEATLSARQPYYDRSISELF